jgi:DNA-binding transcriptional ArsR family regulator
MVRDPSRESEPPAVDDVLDALADEAARRILSALSEPKTASQLSEECDVPLSTTYRKLEKLTDASLLNESTEIRRDGQHTTQYHVAFQAVSVSIDEERGRELVVELDRPERTRDERLADLWSELREET